MKKLMNSLSETVGHFFRDFKDLWKTDTSYVSRSMEEAEGKEAVQEKERDSSESGFDQWWQKRNAEYFRNSCHVYTSFIFRQPGDFDRAFGKALSGFFHTYGSVTPRREFPEIHMIFLTVEVYRLRDTWNRRDINLKQALLMELRRAFVEFARSRGFQFDPWFPFVVSDIWKNMNTLIIELPCSPFPFIHPQLSKVLEPKEYQYLKAILRSRSEL